MHFISLCSVLPSENNEKHPADHHNRQSRHGSCCVILRRALQRLDPRRDVGFCRHRPPRSGSGVFHDTEGVQFPKEKAVAAHSPKTFGYSELYIGTKGFSKSEILGSGGFGRVFRAVLPSDGTVVAVKCLAETGERFEKTFVAELVAVAHLRHRNLVPLRGWCVHDNQLLLVYDYMPNRSLDRVLFRRGTVEVPPLDWRQRVKIAKGLAAALFYLHEQLEAQIIHRDVKTSNVMLDSRFDARLGDFGLARWLEHELKSHIETLPPATADHHRFRAAETTAIGGTIGYLSPESFQKRGSATAKSDVFSFGVVLLEIASGRRAVDLTFPDDQIVLLDWVRRLADERAVLRAADDRLPDGSYELRDMEHLIHLGLLCTVHDPDSRPDMRWVVDAMSGINRGTLPQLPSFESTPRYISVYQPTSSGGSITTTTTTVATTTVVTSGDSTTFTTAKESLYTTAELGGATATAHLSRRRSNVLAMVQPPSEISYKEIVLATGNFSDSNRLAEVDFGTAYRGVLDGRHVVVKRLGMKTCPALRARFSDELSNLGRLRHRNLIQLRGWCTENGEMLVVYDYSVNRLLSNLLSHQVLRWHHRYRIVKSLAGAVQYLHEEWEETVVHRNITASAISIESDMNPRLGSFALAEFLTRNEPEPVHGPGPVDKKTSVRGIFGYMAPEGEATAAADVYSFGVVVLEVVTGRTAVDFRRPEVLLVKRVHEFEARKGNYEELVDPRLDGDYDHEEMVRLVRLATACTRSNPGSRPTMGQAVSILDGHDGWFDRDGRRKENSHEWRSRNAMALSLTRRIQALGIQ